jgi:hypothetical protein
MGFFDQRILTTLKDGKPHGLLRSRARARLVRYSPSVRRPVLVGWLVGLKFNPKPKCKRAITKMRFLKNQLSENGNLMKNRPKILIEVKKRKRADFIPLL